jgi:glycosyltransferase involved in cell wall biosynthesis
MKRLSLVFLVHDLDVQVGGMERQAAQLAEQFVARGHDVRVLSWPDRDLTCPELVPPRREERDGLEIIRVVNRIGIPSAVADDLLVLEMGREVRQRLPDVLYAVHYRGAIHASALRDLLGVPLAVKLACSGPKGDFQTLARGESPAGAAALESAEALVCINTEVRDEALAAGIPSQRLVQIRNAVDVRRFAEAEPIPLGELDLGPSDRPILFVGRLAHQKRLHILLDAAAQALERVPQLCLLIAGEGPELAALRAQAAGLEIQDRVHFLGARDDVPRLLQSVEAFVLPSCSEGISNALLEALAAGTPSIVSRIPGNVEVVEEAALIVDVDDVDSLRDALVEVLIKPEENAARIAAGRKRIQEEFSFEIVTDSYEELFRGLVSRAPKRNLGRFLRKNTRSLPGFARERAFFYAAYGVGRVRAAVTSVVVAAKQRVGHEGDIFGRDSQ